MRSTPSRLRTIAASSGLAALTVTVGAVGAHAATVEVALLEAQRAAQQVEAQREALAQSLDQAASVTESAEAHLEQGVVASAVYRLEGTVGSVTASTALDSVGVEVRASTITPPLVAVAEASAESDATADDDASAEEIAAETAVVSITSDVASGATQTEVDVLADPEVQSVLDGESRDLATVRAATEELERTAEELAAAAADVAEVVGALSDATARADIAKASATLDTVADSVEDPATIEHAAQARDALTEVLDSMVDSDADDAIVNAERLVAAADALAVALDGVRVSHLAWVEAENARIDAVNAQALADYDQAIATALADLTARYRAAAASLSNGWSGAPAGVTYSNGNLPSSELCDIPYAPGHQLQCDAVDALMLADADYFAETGQHLTLTDSYRSYAAQVALRAAKPATAGVPGTSNHGWGMALDFYPEAAAWMTEHGADYGWILPDWAKPGGSKPESWHFEFVAPGVGDADLPEAPVLLEHVTSVFVVGA